jgi:hypothetical protein
MRGSDWEDTSRTSFDMDVRGNIQPLCTVRMCIDRAFVWSRVVSAREIVLPYGIYSQLALGIRIYRYNAVFNKHHV